MLCGSAVFDVGSEKPPEGEIPPSRIKIPAKSIGLKFPIIIGIPILILIVLGAAYSQGMFDDTFENRVSESKVEPKSSTTATTSETNSKCGPGTVFDEKMNACVLESRASSSTSETNSKCGPGTVFDEDSNSCVLDK